MMEKQTIDTRNGLAFAPVAMVKHGSDEQMTQNTFVLTRFRIWDEWDEPCRNVAAVRQS